jgi:hypothetical protein
MAYSDFSLRKVLQDFSLSTQDAGFLPPVTLITPSAYLSEFLERSLPLAVALDNEKARSETLVFPVLLEVREILKRQVSLFSGNDFTVDPSLGLSGVCDYLFSKSAEQMVIRAPVAVIIDAKKSDLTSGMGQCVAEMVAAQTFNQQQGNAIATIYGSVTSGSLWRFLKLENQTVTFDLKEYAMPPVEQILGILVYIASSGKPAVSSVPAIG